MSKVPRLTEAHIRLVHREVADPGTWPGLEHFTEEQYDEHLAAFLRDRPEGLIGVFAYGSLIWKRVFEPAAELRATALGWHRAFSLRQKRFRGTPECPGLMMQIDRGGTCEGVLQMVPEGLDWAILSDVWRREMTVRPPSHVPRWIDVQVQGEPSTARRWPSRPARRAPTMPASFRSERWPPACRKPAGIGEREPNISFRPSPRSSARAFTTLTSGASRSAWPS